MKLIKFKLEKDYDRNVILFTPISYNRRNRYDGSTWAIDFLKKKVHRQSSWTNCYIKDNLFTISFSGTTNPRQFCPLSSDRKHSLFRISDFEPGKTYIFNVERGEDIDTMFDNIINAFKILSNGI